MDAEQCVLVLKDINQHVDQCTAQRSAVHFRCIGASTHSVHFSAEVLQQQQHLFSEHSANKRIDFFFLSWQNF